jgi:hypothetical protein
MVHIVVHTPLDCVAWRTGQAAGVRHSNQ